MEAGSPGRRGRDGGQRAGHPVGEPAANLKRRPQANEDDRREHDHRLTIHLRLPAVLRESLPAGSITLTPGKRGVVGPGLGTRSGLPRLRCCRRLRPDQPRHLRWCHHTRTRRSPPRQLPRMRRLPMLPQMRTHHRVPHLLVHIPAWDPAVGTVAVVQVLVSRLQPTHRSIVFMRLDHVKIGISGYAASPQDRGS